MSPGNAAVSSLDLAPSGFFRQDSILAASEPAGFKSLVSESYDRQPTPDPDPPAPMVLRATPSKELGDLWNMYRFWRKGMA